MGAYETDGDGSLLKYSISYSAKTCHISSDPVSCLSSRDSFEESLCAYSILEYISKLFVFTFYVKVLYTLTTDA